jgi:hypothetical protein
MSGPARSRLQSLGALALTLAILAPLGAAVTNAQPALPHQPACPVVVVATPDALDQDASLAVPATIATLVALTPPAPDVTFEPTLWRVDGIVQQVRLSADNSVEAVLVDVDDPTQTAVASFADPSCIAASYPMLADQVVDASGALMRLCGSPRSAPIDTCGARVVVTGLGAFADQADPAPAGSAPNGIELRPVLALEPRTTATAPLEPTSTPQPRSTLATPLPLANPPTPQGLPTRKPTVAPASNSSDGTQVLSGVAAQDTAAFLLDAGAYSITWTASAPESGHVNFAGFVKPVDPSASGWILVANTIIAPGQKQSGDLEVPSTPTGAYYLNVIGGSSWTVTIRRSQSRPRPQPVPPFVGSAPLPPNPPTPTPSLANPDPRTSFRPATPTPTIAAPAGPRGRIPWPTPRRRP